MVAMSWTLDLGPGSLCQVLVTCVIQVESRSSCVYLSIKALAHFVEERAESVQRSSIAEPRLLPTGHQRRSTIRVTFMSRAVDDHSDARASLGRQSHNETGSRSESAWPVSTLPCWRLRIRLRPAARCRYRAPSPGSRCPIPGPHRRRRPRGAAARASSPRASA